MLLCLVRPVRFFTLVLITCALACFAVPALATSSGPLVVQSDKGGMLRPRYLQIAELYETGREVRIVGEECSSACTLYLGLENICLSPTTRFGFHGPSLLGLLPLSEARFEELSRTMAEFYPEPVRAWFLNEARYLRYDVAYLGGDYLISLGYRACDDDD